MARSTGLSQWQETVSRHMPHLSKPQVTVLALWSFGMVLAQSCGVTSVAATIAPLVGRQEATVRQQLREWCYAAPRKAGAKRGGKRQELEVHTCFQPLLRWVLTWWPPTEQRLAFAMDASTLGQRFTVLAISLMYRGGAIPIAWIVLPATKKGAWRPHWEHLFTLIRPGVPPHWTVIVLADRGLYAKWLYRHIQRMHWHPFLRINVGGNYRPVGQARFRPLTDAVVQGGAGWSGAVTCFSSANAQLQCTLLARWDAGHADPWLILTDLAPEQADVAWYGLRPMIECGFKDTKRGGWHWEQTKMTDPARATRLWLAIAVATLWVVSVGGHAETTAHASMLDGLPSSSPALPCPDASILPPLASPTLAPFCKSPVMIRAFEIPSSARAVLPWWYDTTSTNAQVNSLPLLLGFIMDMRVFPISINTHVTPHGNWGCASVARSCVSG